MQGLIAPLGTTGATSYALYAIGRAVKEKKPLRQTLAKFFSVAVVLPLLGGCLHSTATILDDSLVKVDPSRMGYVAGSVGLWRQGQLYNDLGIQVCDSRDKKIMEFGFRREFAKDDPDVNDSDTVAKTFSISLPDGQYSLCNFWFVLNGGTFTSSFYAKNDFRVPFNVRAGAISYIGEFRGVPVWGRNIFGLKVPNGGYWVVSDKRDRDIPLVSLKNNDLASREVIGSVPQVDSYGIPFLRSTALPVAE